MSTAASLLHRFAMGPVRAGGKKVRDAFDHPLDPPSQTEQDLITDLIDRLRSVPELDADAERIPASEDAWRRNVNELRRLILSEDPREFLRWGVVERTMFIANSSYSRRELNFLRRLPDWKTRWRDVLAEDAIGHPTPFVFRPSTSANLIHHAYHVARFEQETGVRVQNLQEVIEFGGGYGSMCRLVHRLGFCGRYVIYDLAAFSALQTYYLSALGLDVKSTEDRDFSEGVRCTSEVDDAHWLGGSHPRPRSSVSSLFIGTWSLSETPMSAREPWLPILADCDALLIAFQDHFGEAENLEWFEQLEESIAGVDWTSLSIDHLPGNSYLFGAVTPKK